MRAVIQRVEKAEVFMSEKSLGRIDRGFLILLGVGKDDTVKEADLLWRKISNLRIFSDAEGKTNLNLEAVQGNVLLVSQFTLYANCKKGNRPSFIEAASPEKGQQLYEYFLKIAKEKFPDIQDGEFGGDMKINLVNDGPFTIILDTDEL